MHNALEKLQRGSQRRTKQWVWSIFEIISTKSLVVHCVSNHNCESLVNLLGPLFVIPKKSREILCLNNKFSNGSLRLGRNNLYVHWFLVWQGCSHLTRTNVWVGSPPLEHGSLHLESRNTKTNRA